MLKIRMLCGFSHGVYAAEANSDTTKCDESVPRTRDNGSTHELTRTQWVLARGGQVRG